MKYQHIVMTSGFYPSKQRSQSFPSLKERGEREWSMLDALNSRGQLAVAAAVTLLFEPHEGEEVSEVGARLERDFSVSVTLKPVVLSAAGPLGDTLGEFMGLVSACLRSSGEENSLFAPVGGSKRMSTLGYLAGSWRGVPTVFVDEHNPEVLHFLPAVPIRVDVEDLKEVAQTLGAVGEGVALSSLSPVQREHVSDTFSWLFSQLDGRVSVNPIGAFVMESEQYAGLFK